MIGGWRSSAEVGQAISQQIGPPDALGIGDWGTDQAKQQRDGIAEVGIEPRRARPLGQLHLLDLGPHLVPLLVNRGRGRGKLLDRHGGEAGPGGGLDLLDGFERADFALDGLGHQLLHFRGRRARELRDQHVRSLRNGGVLLLAELRVGHTAQHQHGNQRQPAHLPVLDTKLGQTALFNYIFNRF